ncbi:MAG: 3-isopropylmalate dehydratase small subunit [Kiritimatiellae bacterium]|nr:3-isopropylmalate dehydratase small subunit [Kiritimatiellia bacterium]
MKPFGGNVLFLNRSDINTDEIIPAKYLTESSKMALRPYLLEDLTLEGFNPKADVADKAVVVSRANFGCGSSREHAPWALEVNGIQVVIAESYARIFRQNMFNCGLLAIELTPEQVELLFSEYAGHASVIRVDLDGSVLHVEREGRKDEIPFHISDFDRALVEAGGWVDYADARYP